MTRPRYNRSLRLATALGAGLLLCVAGPALGDDADDAFRTGTVYAELYRISLDQWERAYQIMLPSAKEPTPAGFLAAAEIPWFAGLCAFHRGEYGKARERMALAATRAGDKALGRDARVWAALCLAAKNHSLDPDAIQRLAGQGPEAPLHVVYALDALGLAKSEGLSETYAHIAAKATGAGTTYRSPTLRRWQAWLRFRTTQDPTAYFALASREPDFSGGSLGTEGKHGLDLWDVARLHHLAQVYFARARGFADRRQLVHVQAALRLGEYEQARKLSRRGGARAGRNRQQADPAERAAYYRWKILKAHADELSGQEGALPRLRRRLANPAFAQEQKEIYYLVAQDLAETLAEAGLLKEAKQVAESAVESLEANYKAKWPAARLTEYYETTRPVYAALAHLCFRNGDSNKSFDVYGLVYPWHRQAWLAELRENPLFGVRYSALLFGRNNLALARELVYNYQPYGLIAEFPEAAQLHSVSSTLE